MASIEQAVVWFVGRRDLFGKAPRTPLLPGPSTLLPPRYFMIGGSQSGTVGTQQGLVAAGGQVALPGDGVFGPGVIGRLPSDTLSASCCVPQVSVGSQTPRCMPSRTCSAVPLQALT